MDKFDYIIAGTGAAGLQLAWLMSHDVWFDDKKILLVDRDQKTLNDRTWCYWEKGSGSWDGVVCKTWDRIFFEGKNFKKTFDLEGYRYKMIRSADFYRQVLEHLGEKRNFHFLNASVLGYEESDDAAVLKTDTGVFSSSHIFTSIPSAGAMDEAKQDLWLSQHFKGWFVKTKNPVFKADAVVMMDYSVEQNGNTRFMYVLPTNAHEALVEYTLFSANVLNEQDYDNEIKKYLHGLGCEAYEIIETEAGQIPMTAYPFWKANTKHVMHIGTAGGWTKPSSGYTFYFAGKRSQDLLKFLKHASDLRQFSVVNRFRFYDLVMLDLLCRKNEMGKDFFTSVYANHNIHRIFDFLNEESNVIDELAIILASSPKLELVKSVWNVMKRAVGRT